MMRKLVVKYSFLFRNGKSRNFCWKRKAKCWKGKVRRPLEKWLTQIWWQRLISAGHIRFSHNLYKMVSKWHKLSCINILIGGIDPNKRNLNIFIIYQTKYQYNPPWQQIATVQIQNFLSSLIISKCLNSINKMAQYKCIPFIHKL